MKILQAINLTKCYDKVPVVSQVSFEIEEGEIYGFVGKNGAGKSTVIRMILNFIKNYDGKIVLFEEEEVYSVKPIGGFVEYPSIYPSMTALENLMVQAKLCHMEDKESLLNILKEVGLKNDKKKAKYFSLGMKQRLAIGIALVGSPKLLVLDEPMNGLDPMGIREIRELLVKLNKKYGMTIFISSHMLTELSKIATKYGFMKEGRLVEEISAEELEEKLLRLKEKGVKGDLLEEYFMMVMGEQYERID